MGNLISMVIFLVLCSIPWLLQAFLFQVLILKNSNLGFKNALISLIPMDGLLIFLGKALVHFAVYDKCHFDHPTSAILTMDIVMLRSLLIGLGITVILATFLTAYLFLLIMNKKPQENFVRNTLIIGVIFSLFVVFIVWLLVGLLSAHFGC